MNRELQVTLNHDGTGTLRGVALVPRSPFTARMIELLAAQARDQAAKGHLFATLNDHRGLPQSATAVRLADVAAMLDEVIVDDGALVLGGKLLATPRGGDLRQWLRHRAEREEKSGLALTVLAMGSDDRDVKLVGICIVTLDLVELET